MNFDELKNDWSSEPDENVQLPDSLQGLYGSQSPIGKIRTNMKRESVAQLIAIIIGGVAPYIIQMNSVLRFPYYLFYALMIALTIYFFSKFYFFYNKMGRMEWSTKESLYELYYGAKLNIEIYKSFTYMFIPYAIILGMFVRVSTYYNFDLPAFADGKFYGFSLSSYIIAFALILILIYVMTEAWVKKSYGRYVKEIEVIIEDMREG